MVTVTATTNGAQGNLITLAEGLTNFTWAGITLAGGVGTGNIVAFNQLYSTQGSVGGLCNQNGPSVYWSYFTGTGQALTSVVLSGDGTKVAFVENAAGGATLRILKWKAGEGTGAGYPVAPTTTLSAGQSWAANCPAGNSCISSIAFNGAFQDTRSAPFYNYNTDTLYVGDDSSRMHKFTGVFNGTPAEVIRQLADPGERDSQSHRPGLRWRIREYLRRRRYGTPELHPGSGQLGRGVRCGQPAVSGLGQPAGGHGRRHC